MRRLRVAVLTTSPSATLAPEAVALTRQTAELLAGLGHTVDEVAPMIGTEFAEDFVLYWGSLAWTTLRMGRTLGEGWDPSRTEPFTRGLAEHFMANARKLPGAIRRLRRTPATMAALHDRMPVVLGEVDWAAWLGETGAADAAALLRPCPAEWLTTWRVSARVNKHENNDAGLLERVA